MALRHRGHGFRSIEILLGEETIRLPNEIIRTYLPNLWRYSGRRATIRGIINLERVMEGKPESKRLALSIILRALEASKTDRGVASELKLQLHLAHDRHVMNHPDPERAMCITFSNVVKLLEPRSLLGRNEELAYALSEWFTTLAAENILQQGTVIHYVKALDRLRAEMTGPVLALLRCDVRDSHLQCWTRARCFRQTTLRKMRSLMASRPRQGLSLPNHGLVRGGDVDPLDVLDLYMHDPDSIMIDPRYLRPNRVYDGGYSTSDSASDSEDDFYTSRYPLDHGYLPPVNGVRLGPHHLGLPDPRDRFLAPQARILPRRSQSPRLMIEHAPIIARPGPPRRLKTWHNMVSHSLE
ncbi:MAG: hypothetical protein LQ346_007572 [Caloplaca aetnensis]|nr:MAG: hypothetical protein LQ346_007572 [Caloplaca aetnensis]